MPSNARHLEVHKAEVANDSTEGEKVWLSERAEVARGLVNWEDCRVVAPMSFDDTIALDVYDDFALGSGPGDVGEISGNPAEVESLLLRLHGVTDLEDLVPTARPHIRAL